MDGASGGKAFLTRIRIVEQTGSTNADLIADHAAIEGDWLVALEQRSGKGPAGAELGFRAGQFLRSTLVQLDRRSARAALSLVAGLALIEAVDVAVPGQPLMLKWPNDLLLLGRKIAGILLERSGDRVAIGFGVNLASAPDLPDRQAASLGGQGRSARLSRPCSRRASRGCSACGGKASRR